MGSMSLQAADLTFRRYWICQGGQKLTVQTPAELQVALKLGPWMKVYAVPEPAPMRRMAWNEFWRAG